MADALYLSKLCREVYLIHRRDTLRASKVYMDALKDSGIQILWNSRAVGLLRDKRVSGLVLEDVRTGARRELACEGIFVAIGRVPDTELFRGQVELDEQGYIKADETTPHRAAGGLRRGGCADQAPAADRDRHGGRGDGLPFYRTIPHGRKQIKSRQEPPRFSVGAPALILSQ